MKDICRERCRVRRDVRHRLDGRELDDLRAGLLWPERMDAGAPGRPCPGRCVCSGIPRTGPLGICVIGGRFVVGPGTGGFGPVEIGVRVGVVDRWRRRWTNWRSGRSSASGRSFCGRCGWSMWRSGSNWRGSRFCGNRCAGVFVSTAGAGAGGAATGVATGAAGARQRAAGAGFAGARCRLLELRRLEFRTRARVRCACGCFLRGLF